VFKHLIHKFDWYKRIILHKIGIKRKYKISGYSLKIDYTSFLPDFEIQNPFFNKFLPHLSSYLPKDSFVIDVGANVGDTLFGMIGRNINIQYLCIEADPEFYSSLLNNIKILLDSNPNLRIFSANEFVGKDLNNIELGGSGGTKHALTGSGKVQSKSISKILFDIKIQPERVSLLKSDVDGFDWDVIRSSYDSLSHRPYIYFECQFDDLNQFRNYQDMFQELISIGYKGFAFFDNLGQYICTADNLTQIFDLIDYIKRQNFHESTRTLYYYDILAFNANKVEEVGKIIEDYNYSKF